MKKLGILIFIIGVLLIMLFFGYNLIKNKKELDSMNNYLEQTSNIIDNNVSEIEEVSEQIETTESKNEIDYKAILEIPIINLKSGIVDNTENFNSINYAISADNSSNYPNENGNFILYSHSGNSSIAFFKKLYKVNVNDSVYVYFNGIKYEYKIFKKYDIPKTGKAKVINSKKDRYITLITCNQSHKGYQIVMIGKLINTQQY